MLSRGVLSRIFAATGLVWLWVTVLVVIADRITKYAANAFLIPYEALPVMPSFNLTLAYNKGAAFNFLDSASGWQGIFLGSIAVIVSVCILVWMYRNSAKQYWLNVTLAFILGGALGNFWDRLEYGHVVDFIQLYISHWSWPVFNVADSAISVGTMMLLWYWLVRKQ
ncbi:MAG: signal peptidase II [Gammaproteobacteria bacterium RIFCSPHIGHO2_12_FULL_41_20]|nr:MAG: signal peptidase II [Gammaproteobacteria bacterium RIFCSPHIGHO2_12_FULL_41_20]